jgi:thiamine-monophosphate kinase
VDLFAAALQDFVEPLREAEDLLGADPMEWVLGGGEDHGLLCTFPAAAALPDGFVAVGAVRGNGSAAATLDGAAVQARGWDHFGG